MREDLAARLDHMAHTFEETRVRILTANKAIAELRVTRQTEDGSIEVTVGTNGDIADLKIADAALRRGDGRALADTLLALIAEARTELTGAAQAEYQRLTGLCLDPGALGERDASDVLKRFSRELFGG